MIDTADLSRAPLDGTGAAEFDEIVQRGDVAVLADHDDKGVIGRACDADQVIDRQRALAASDGE